MDRNRFLQLAALYLSGAGTKVKYSGIEYHPISYTIAPDGQGGWFHTVKLRDSKAGDSYVIAPLRDIEEVE